MDEPPDLASSGNLGLIGSRSISLAVTGTIAAGVALAVGADAGLGTWAVIAAILAELVAFFLAHAYVDMLGEHLSQPRTPLWKRFEHACSHDVLLLVGGLPILLVFVVETMAGLNANLGANVALALLIALLGVFAIVAARRSGAPWPAALGEGVLAAALGALVLVLKLLLH